MHHSTPNFPLSISSMNLFIRNNLSENIKSANNAADPQLSSIHNDRELLGFNA